MKSFGIFLFLPVHQILKMQTLEQDENSLGALRIPMESWGEVVWVEGCWEKLGQVSSSLSITSPITWWLGARTIAHMYCMPTVLSTVPSTTNTAPRKAEWSYRNAHCWVQGAAWSVAHFAQTHCSHPLLKQKPKATSWSHQPGQPCSKACPLHHPLSPSAWPALIQANLSFLPNGFGCLLLPCATPIHPPLRSLRDLLKHKWGHVTPLLRNLQWTCTWLRANPWLLLYSSPHWPLQFGLTISSPCSHPPEMLVFHISLKHDHAKAVPTLQPLHW